MRLSSFPLTDISSNWLGKYEGLKHHWRHDLSHTRGGLAWASNDGRNVSFYITCESYQGSPVMNTTHAKGHKTTMNWPLCNLCLFDTKQIYNRKSRKPSILKIKHSFCLHEWRFVDQLILPHHRKNPITAALSKPRPAVTWRDDLQTCNNISHSLSVGQNSRFMPLVESIDMDLWNTVFHTVI